MLNDNIWVHAIYWYLQIYWMPLLFIYLFEVLTTYQINIHSQNFYLIKQISSNKTKKEIINDVRIMFEGWCPLQEGSWTPTVEGT